MSGTITTFRGYEWSQAPQDLIAALRLAGQPVARIDESAVAERELVAADVIAIAGDVPAPARQSYTFLADQLVNAHTVFMTGAITVTGATTAQHVVVDNPLLLFIVDGFVSAAGTVKLLVRNDHAANETIPAGTVINFILV